MPTDKTTNEQERERIVEAAIRVWRESVLDEEAMRDLFHAIAERDGETIETIGLANEP